MVKIRTFSVGSLCTNCYLLVDTATNEMAIVDPGYKSQGLLDAVNAENSGKVKYILLTHGHFDHIGEAKELAKKYNAKIVIGEKEKDFLWDSNLNLSLYHPDYDIPPFKADILLKDNDTINLGETEIKYIETPGHTAGSGCYIFNDIILSGDTLFNCSIGRTDFPTSSFSDMQQSLGKLANLQGNYTVYTGHGEKTTLDYERKVNPYLK